MGKASIVSGGPDGSYSVTLDMGEAARTARLAALDEHLSVLVGQIATAQTALNAQQGVEDAKKVTVQAAIAAYVAAAHAVPVVDATLKAALSAYLKLSAELLAEKRKTAPLRLALEALQAAQTQAQKDRAYWAALVLSETRQAWCADLTQDATGTVATLEIPGESTLVLIEPSAPQPTAEHGLLTAREVQSGPQAFWNAAALPGWQKWKPTYRRATVTAINGAADTADVLLDDDVSSAQGLGINQTPTLANVPVQYMTCHSAAFEVGDRCVVKFTNQDWGQPKIVGFVDNPKSCSVLLSGVVRGGALVTLAAPPGSPPGTLGTLALHEYRPTQNAWQYGLRSHPEKSPNAYHDEPQLARGGDQYQSTTASSYSGLMAKTVQILMGLGRPVLYDYKWALGHGVVLAADGAPFVVQISQMHGVLAMPLRVVKGNASSTNVAEAQAVLLLGGLPAGEAFPAGAALASAQEAGSVLTLATPESMAPFFEKLPWATWLGWSFDATGREARHTCYTQLAGVTRGYLYRLDIAISKDPLASYTGSAVLAEMENGVLERINFDTYPISFAPENGDPLELPIPWVANFSAPGTESPVFVRHDGTGFDVMRLRMQPLEQVTQGPSELKLPAPQGYAVTHAKTLSSHMVSDTKPGLIETLSEWRSLSGTTIASEGAYGQVPGSPAYIPGTKYLWQFSSGEGVDRSAVRYAAVVEGMRDGYIFYEHGETVVERRYAGTTVTFVATGIYPDPNAEPDPRFSNTYSNLISQKDVVPPNRTAIVRPDGAPDLLLEPTISNESQAGEILLWGNSFLYQLSTGHPMFTVRHSMFGSSPHTQHSAHVWAASHLLSGPLFAGEPQPSTPHYNFVGYLQNG